MTWKTRPFLEVRLARWLPGGLVGFCAVNYDATMVTMLKLEFNWILANMMRQALCTLALPVARTRIMMSSLFSPLMMHSCYKRYPIHGSIQ